MGWFWGYLATMDWQQLVSLTLVGAAAVVLVRGVFRRERVCFERDTHCRCTSSQTAPRHTVVFRARKGERPQIIVRMK
jgi:hypothetical protein